MGLRALGHLDTQAIWVLGYLGTQDTRAYFHKDTDIYL